MNKVEILYPGITEAEVHNGLLEALESVINQGKQDLFFIRQSPESDWEDGSKLIRGFRTLFM